MRAVVFFQSGIADDVNTNATTTDALPLYPELLEF